ncbi:hypothetical protein ABIC74_001742 [Mucilaginibacter rubeus]
MATFFDYASATTVFFNNLDRNWPAEMTVLLVMILLLMFLVRYIIKGLQKMGRVYMEIRPSKQSLIFEI